MAQRANLENFLPLTAYVSLLKHNLLEAVFDVLNDGFMCGFTEHDIVDTSPDGEYRRKKIVLVSPPSIAYPDFEEVSNGQLDFQPYIIDVYSILTGIVNYLTKICEHSKHLSTLSSPPAACPECTIVATALEVIAARYAPFLEALWKVAERVLDRGIKIDYYDLAARFPHIPEDEVPGKCTAPDLARVNLGKLIAVVKASRISKELYARFLRTLNRI